MKPGLAVLPLEVWTDVFVCPWITRKQLARIVHKFKNRKFIEKLQFRLHDMGKHTLQYLTIEKEIFFQFASRALLFVSSVRCEFPETEMPENIRGFKLLSISYVDDQVLDFLGKIRPLLSNVTLDISGIESASDIDILFGHLLPLVASIRRINCGNPNSYCLEYLESHYPVHLASAKELHLPYANPFYIRSYLNWLTAPQDFDQHGPRFLTASINFETITAIAKAVSKQFLSATSPSTFIIFLDFFYRPDAEQLNSIEEFKLENAATKEELVVRTAICKIRGGILKMDHPYVEILRHQTGADANMQQWIKERAHYENNYKYEAKQQIISIDGQSLTIGRITNNGNNADAVDQAEDELVSDEEDDAGLPSTSAGLK